MDGTLNSLIYCLRKFFFFFIVTGEKNRVIIYVLKETSARRRFCFVEFEGVDMESCSQ